MSVMLAGDVIIRDTMIHKVVQEGDSVHRIGTTEALEIFQGLVPGDPFMAVISGQERTMAEYGLHVSALCVCTCTFVWADGQAKHYQDRSVCSLPAYAHL
jgi:hypothetical protein